MLSHAKSLLFVKAGATVADFPLKREGLERERERERERDLLCTKRVWKEFEFSAP